MKHADVIIIGAGLIGMASARELARRGMAVRIVDKHDIGGGASHAAGGIISPLRPWSASAAVDELAATSQSLYPDLVSELQHDTGIDPEYLPSGMFVRGRQHIKPATVWAKQRGICVQIVSADAPPPELPALIGPQPGVFLPGICQVRNPLLIRALFADIRQRGVQVHSGVEVESVDSKGGKIRGLITNQGRICAERVVICAGAWSSGIQGQSGANCPIRPVRGQMIWFQAPVCSGLPIVDDGEHYALRRRDGVTLVGSTVEEVGFDVSVTLNALKTLKNKAPELMSDLAGLEVRGQWAGLRPASRDDGPHIGAHPRLEGLFYNTGHHRNGVTLAPASARRLADLVAHGAVQKAGLTRPDLPVF